MAKAQARIVQLAQPLPDPPQSDRPSESRMRLPSSAQVCAKRLQVSERVLATDEPCIVKTKQMMEGVAGVVSLAQGVVHWAPPQSALDAARDAAGSAAAHAYGPAQGSPVLRAALRDKVAAENGLHNVRPPPALKLCGAVQKTARPEHEVMRFALERTQCMHNTSGSRYATDT